jgi:hypothetical protein
MRVSAKKSRIIARPVVELQEVRKTTGLLLVFSQGKLLLATFARPQ